MTKLVFPTRQPILGQKLRSMIPEAKITLDRLEKSSAGMPVPLGTESIESSLEWEFDNLFVSNIVGINKIPTVMSREEVLSLGDHFTQNIILQGKFPLDLRQLLDEISTLGGDKALPLRQLFLVAEGGQHQNVTSDFPLNARLVYSWRKSSSHFAEILLSTVPHLDEKDALMQLIAWSPKDGSFHFFERLGDFWTWAGSGHHAFNENARGLGPFDSHINGGLVMKELKFPWAHWHSMANTIPVSLLADTDFGKHPALAELGRAEDLESIVMAANRAWVRSRFEQAKTAGEIQHPRVLMRQVLTATSVNLVSSATEYSPTLSGSITLPRSFFLDTDSISKLARRAGIENPIPSSPLEIDAPHYVEALKELDVGIQASSNGPRILGDTHFCFLVPERAFEDHIVVIRLEKEKLLSAKFLLCLHMVDFSNPVESRFRSSLLRHVPETSTPFREKSLEEPLLDNIRREAANGSGAENEFLTYWNSENIEEKLSSVISNYLIKLQVKLSSSEGVLEVTKLAEARRNNFRKRKLHEFEATIAKSTQEVPNLVMDANANISQLIS